MRYLAIIFIIVLSCAPKEPLYENDYARITDYQIKADKITPHGIAVDQSGFEINLLIIDLMIDKTERCLLDHFSEIAPFCEKQKNLCQEISRDSNHPEFWKCHDIAIGCSKYKRVEKGLDRSAIEIKIATDWRLACDQKTMVFPCGIDPKPCHDKGIEPTLDCPCSCRSTIQDSDIITTPQFQILAGELVRLTTGFNNPWNVPPISTCANIIP